MKLGTAIYILRQLQTTIINNISLDNNNGNNEKLNQKIIQDCYPYIKSLFISLMKIEKLKNYFINAQKLSEENKISFLLSNFMIKFQNDKKHLPNIINNAINEIQKLNTKSMRNLNFKDLIDFILINLHKELNTKKIENYENIYEDYDENTIYKKFNKFFSQNDSIISKLFFNEIETISMCKKCKRAKYNFGICKYLFFDIKNQNTLSLNYLLKDFENRINNLKKYCEICREDNLDISENQKINLCSEILIIILNNEHNTEIEFKLEENINNINYNLICYINKSTIENNFNVIFPSNQKWYKFQNDFNEKEIGNNFGSFALNPQVLFYEIIYDNNIINSNILINSNQNNTLKNINQSTAKREQNKEMNKMKEIMEKNNQIYNQKNNQMNNMYMNNQKNNINMNNQMNNINMNNQMKYMNMNNQMNNMNINNQMNNINMNNQMKYIDINNQMNYINMNNEMNNMNMNNQMNYINMNNQMNNKNMNMKNQINNLNQNNCRNNYTNLIISNNNNNINFNNQCNQGLNIRNDKFGNNNINIYINNKNEKNMNNIHMPPNNNNFKNSFNIMNKNNNNIQGNILNNKNMMINNINNLNKMNNNNIIKQINNNFPNNNIYLDNNNNLYNNMPEYKNKNDSITLYFEFSNKNKIYIDTKSSSYFRDVIRDLREKYSWLNDIQIKDYKHNGKSVDHNKTLYENLIKNSSVIKIIE